jgi:two-component system, NarL family, response regulator DevR
MSEPTAIRVFIVDDHPMVRAGLRSIEDLAPHIHIVGEASSVEGARAGILEHLPDVVLLDIRMGDGSGIELCRRIKAMLPAVRVLLLSSYLDDQLILSALDAGVDGYLLKEDDAERLVEAIEHVRSGDAVFDEAVRDRLTARKENWRGGTAPSLDSLSAQEIRLLAEVAKGKTDKEVAAELGLSPKTARNYLDRIFSKLGVHTRTEAATMYILSGRRMWGGG